MNESFVHALILAISLIGVIGLIVLLNKTGFLTKIADGSLWSSGQQNYEASHVTY